MKVVVISTQIIAMATQCGNTFAHSVNITIGQLSAGGRIIKKIIFFNADIATKNYNRGRLAVTMFLKLLNKLNFIPEFFIILNLSNIASLLITLSRTPISPFSSQFDTCRENITNLFLQNNAYTCNENICDLHTFQNDIDVIVKSPVVGQCEHKNTPPHPKQHKLEMAVG
jgi:hypothetical protein